MVAMVWRGKFSRPATGFECIAHAQTFDRGESGDRAEKRKWLRQCPAASNVGSSARSFKMIEILRGKNHLCLRTVPTN